MNEKMKILALFILDLLIVFTISITEDEDICNPGYNNGKVTKDDCANLSNYTINDECCLVYYVDVDHEYREACHLITAKMDLFWSDINKTKIKEDIDKYHPLIPKPDIVYGYRCNKYSSSSIYLKLSFISILLVLFL